jgi:beta-fructofuranosidase
VKTMQPTRREFLNTTAALAAMTALPRGIFAQNTDEAIQARLADDPMRPQFHLLPARNWMNDPNGPIYFNGKYHMFFQYNPLAAVWGDMSWNHAVSSDMLHWHHEPLAFTPTPGGPDSFGCFSGSAIAAQQPDGKGKRVYAVYTGTQKSDDAHATIRDGANNIQESQCLAWSDDPMLVKWQKDPAPIIPAPPADMKITGFRDPSVWRSGDWYYMTVGSGVERAGGCVLLYRSPASGNLKQWEYMHPLTSGTWNGVKTANPCDDGEMWECPEFFALGDGHVLIYSTLGKVFWQSGTLAETTMKFTPKKTGELDWGAFYAPKTQLDAQGRRILWGWIPERRSEAAMKVAGWSGMMALPRVMTLDQDGTLRLQVLPQANALRGTKFPPMESRAGQLRKLPCAAGEVLCIGGRDKSFNLTFTDGNLQLASVSYSAADHTLSADGHTIVLVQNDVPSVHAFVDGSVIELILGERIGYTKRFYYTSSTAPDILVSTSDGPKLQAWTMMSISKNRLTTPTVA